MNVWKQYAKIRYWGNYFKSLRWFGFVFGDWASLRRWGFVVVVTFYGVEFYRVLSLKSDVYLDQEENLWTIDKKISEKASPEVVKNLPKVRAPKDLESIFVLKAGESLETVLRRFGFGTSDVFRAMAALDNIYNVKNLQVGQTIFVSYRENPDELILRRLFFQADIHTVYTINRKNNEFTARKESKILKRQVRKLTGKITRSFYEDALQQGADPNMISQMIRLFSYDINFQLDVQIGDTFALWYDEWFDDVQGVSKPIHLCYMRLTLSGKVHRLYRYQAVNGSEAFYDSKGIAPQKTLLKTPIPGARLSSLFGMRRHPVLGFSKLHKGVDFAAPEGTPIMAAGDGIIEKARPFGSYGNYVRIRHPNSDYKTAYAHLSRYGTFRENQKVIQGQIIGYVGSTGRSTAPHLHYEVIYKGRPVDPRKITQMSRQVLKGTQLKHFQKVINHIKKDCLS